jgi:hypothetical protein
MAGILISVCYLVGISIGYIYIDTHTYTKVKISKPCIWFIFKLVVFASYMLSIT